MKNRRGFTLVEMMVVIAIIVFLSAVAMTGISQYTKRARDLSANINAHSAALASQEDIVDNYLTTTRSTVAIGTTNNSVQAINPTTAETTPEETTTKATTPKETPKETVWLNNTDKSLYQMRGIGQIPRKGLPLYVVSTTCSGAESSACSLAHNERQISTYYSEYLVPDAVVLDPDLVLRLPMENMAAAAMLALSHATEAFISPLSKEFPADRANLLIAIPIFFSFLEKSYKHGAGNDGYLQMMMAPYYTGVATRRIGFGPAHSLSIYVSEKYSETPGKVSAVILPLVLENEFNEVKEELAVLARAAHLCSARATTEEAARAYISGIRSLCRRVDIPAALPFLKLEDSGDIIIGPCAGRYVVADDAVFGCDRSDQEARAEHELLVERMRVRVFRELQDHRARQRNTQ